LGNRENKRPTDYDEECGDREEGTPRDAAHRVFDRKNRPRRASEKDQLDVVDDKWDEGQQPRGGRCQSLEDDEGQEEVGGQWEVSGEERGSQAEVICEVGQCGNDTGGERDDQERVDDLEEKVAGHQAEFNVCTFGNALEARQETENDGEKGHEDREQNWGKDTTNDTRDDGRETAKPTKPTVGRAQLWDIGQSPDECNWDCPEDDLR